MPTVRKLVYAHLGLLVIGQGLLLSVLLRHRSNEPVVLGRYSLRFGSLVGLALILFIATVVWLFVNGRQLASVTLPLERCCARWPSLAGSVIAGGSVVVVGTIVFRGLVDLIVPAVPVLLGLTLAYVGVAGVLACAAGRAARAQAREGFGLVWLALLLVGFAAETALRWLPPFDSYLVLPREMVRGFDPAPGVMPGVRGPSVFSTNEVGVRGDLYEAEGRYNVLAIGGSTTECAYLDDSEAWPYLVQQLLNDKRADPRVWVGNVGRSGHGVVEHIYVMRSFVPQLEIDAAIVMAGFNDLVPAWRYPAQYDPGKHSPTLYPYYLHRSFYRRPLYDPALGRRFPEGLALFNLVEMGFWRILGATRSPLQYLYVEDRAGENYVERRRDYNEATVVIDEVPDLTAAIAQYERNLRALVDAAGQQGVRLILATQPAIYSERLSDRAFRLLWLGRRTDGDYRYSVRVMASALGRFNATMLDVCRETGTECIDVAKRMSGDESYYYDDVHFNERGARVVARIVHEYLEHRPR